MNTTHGGSFFYQDKSYIDLSANINLLGLHPEISIYLKNAAVNTDMLCAYPDSNTRALNHELSLFYEVDLESVISCAGAVDFLYLVTSVLAKKTSFKPLIVEPAFNEYETAINTYAPQTVIKKITLKKEDSFDFTYKTLEELESKIKLGVTAVYLAVPSNPAGRVISGELLQKICSLCEQNNVYLILDVCFAQFVPVFFDEVLSLVKNYKSYSRLIVVNAFTKFYGAAGIRCGYAVVSDKALMKSLVSEIRPWALSTLAVNACAGVIRSEVKEGRTKSDWSQDTLKALTYEKSRLYRMFDECGIEYLPGAANYIVFFEKHRDIKKLLQDKGIIIRALSDYKSDELSDAYRICVGEDKSVTLFIDAMLGLYGKKKPESQSHKAVPIMIQGTMSDAGKSVFTAALCRIFKQDGYKVAPFKSQNMALNSGVTKDGLEMGRAQIMQAEACGIECDVAMNPILLKPASDHKSQVIINGKAQGTMTASDYFKYRSTLKETIMDAFNKLAESNDIIVIEGAGSPAEINLRTNDIVNMGLAEMTDSPVILVGDIDRGGVFASLYGTAALVTQKERERIKGFVINKFRGDVKLLENGFDMLKGLTDINVLGVVPYIQDLRIDDEDSLALEKNDCKNRSEVKIHIQVVHLSYISNFTDLYPFYSIPFCKVSYFQTKDEYFHNEQEWGKTDLVIIPGSKNTVASVQTLASGGLNAFITELNKNNTPVMGICGGYQIMGKALHDPDGFEDESALQSIEGLGLLETETVFTDNKTLLQVDDTIKKVEGWFDFISGCKVKGYEIHSGITSLKGEKARYAFNGCSFGTYIHGFFDSPDVISAVVNGILTKKGLEKTDVKPYLTDRQSEYDRLADNVRKNIDMEYIYKILKERGLK